jgi:hypothetical protein
MTRSRDWLLTAKDHWRRGGDALLAGRCLYERLAVHDRPSWACGVLDACSAGLSALPAELRTIREIALTPNRWHEAREAFQAVRKLTIAAESTTDNAGAPELGILYLAENVAKVSYNASGCSALFDHDAGWWVAKNARWIIDQSSEMGLEKRVWSALSGQPDLANVAKIDARDLRLLWIDDYYDGALSGAVLVAERLCWFAFCGEVADRRRYTVHALSDAEAANERHWHDLFVEHVGDHWTYDEDGSRGTVKPLSEHAKFYDAYAKRAPVDYTRNAILGWFEL